MEELGRRGAERKRHGCASTCTCRGSRCEGHLLPDWRRRGEIDLEARAWDTPALGEMPGVCLRLGGGDLRGVI